MAPRPIFLDYDQAALDREYDNRAKVSDHAHWLARYPQQSARARAALPSRLDAAYGVTRGVSCDVGRLAAHHHFSIIAELEDSKSQLGQAILRQIGAGSRSS